MTSGGGGYSKVALDILSIISSYNIRPVSDGKVLIQALESKDFNNMFYGSTVEYGSVTINRIFQSYTIPILTSRGDRFTNAFKLRYKNGTTNINETSNVDIQLLSSSFKFLMSPPKQLEPFNYREGCAIRILIIRENVRVHPTLGPKLEDILDLTTIPEDAILMAHYNLNNSVNYQVLVDTYMVMDINNPRTIIPIDLSYLSGAELKMDATTIDQTVNPINGNIYIAVVKETLNSRINVDPENLTEISRIKKTIMQIEPEKVFPNIECVTRHVFQ